MKSVTASVATGRETASVSSSAMPSPPKSTSRLGQRGQVVIPKEIRDRLGLGLHTELEFEEQGGVITMRPKKDMAAFRRHMKKWKGAFAGELQRDGFKDVDDFIRVMRSR